MTLREVLTALRANWWLPLAGLVLGGALAAGLTLLQTPMYTSTTQLFVSTAAATSSSDAYSGGQFSQARATSYEKLLTGEELAARIARSLNMEASASALQREITASAEPGTVLIDVAVTDASPVRAQQVARAIGTEFPSMVDSIETPGQGGIPLVRVTVTEPPQLPSAPSSPAVERNILLGLAGGLVVGALAALARVRLDRSVKNPEQAADLVGTPVIATVLRDDALARQHLVGPGVATRTGEDYRQLRTNLQFLNVDKPPKVIMVTSAIPSEGKTTIVVNLALALADAGQRVAIVEADLRRPKVTKYLEMIGDVGLTNILAGTASIADVVQTYREGLSVVAAGPTPPNPGELLASSQMNAVVEKLRTDHDIVLIDAPPVLPVADATGLAATMDGVLMVVRYGHTRREQVKQAASALERVGATMLGLIVNVVPARAEYASAYAYGVEYGPKRVTV